MKYLYQDGKVKSIYDTCLIPYIIADRAVWNVLEEDIRTNDYSPEKCQQIADMANQMLCDRAERHYKQKGQFYKGINSKRNDPRQYLEMFMEHWFKKLLDQYLKGIPMSFEILTTTVKTTG